MSHVRSVLVVARIGSSNLVVRLSLVELVGAHVHSDWVCSIWLVMLANVLLTIHWGHWCHHLVWMLVTVMSLVLGVNLVASSSWVQGKVGESAANLGHDSPSTCSVSNATVALSIGSARDS